MIIINTENFEKLKNRLIEILDSSKLYGIKVLQICKLPEVYDYIINNYLSEDQLKEYLDIIDKSKKEGD